MSQLALQTREGPSDHYQARQSPPAKSSPPSLQDSPTIGRAQVPVLAPSTANNQLPSSPSTSRSKRKPAPSPLQTTTAISPPTSASPTRQTFPSPLLDSYPRSPLPRIVTTAAPDEDGSDTNETSYYHSDSSGGGTPDVDNRKPRPAVSPSSPGFPNDTRSASDPVMTSTPIRRSSAGLSSTMASRTDAANDAMRTTPAESTTATPSSRSAPSSGSDADVANLISSSGSAEEVIKYLLKEKNSQAQQNSQLWRLVDKQRAMILGLNKDLERALKDKEKYRKKLKELMNEVPPLPTASGTQAGPSAKSFPRIEVDLPPKHQVLDIPLSPGLDSDSQKHSPIDVTMAPYPITPPADLPMPGSEPSREPSAVEEMLDPSHVMPKPSEHALGQFDHDAEEREAEAARKQVDASNDIPLNLGLPPSRSIPSEPPRMPLPQPPPPPAPPVATPTLDQDIAAFPPPPQPPPRKPPPAPLQLRNLNQSPTVPPEEELETDSDYDDILEVEEIPKDDGRGRRRTREEDEHIRELLARKEAEARSLSKKSRKSGSQSGTPKEEKFATLQNEIPPSPRLDQHVPSLSSVLSSNNNTREVRLTAPTFFGAGLPSTPRAAMQIKSPVSSPPLSPLGVTTFAGAALSPRQPRQPIPLPPNTPMHTPSPVGLQLNLSSPKPLNIVKKETGSTRPASPEKSSRATPTDRTRVFKGLVTEEYPDLLLPPNALPSIDIRVASSRMKPSRASLLSLTQLEEDPVFTLAIFSRSDGGELWRVEKDSASLVKLDQRLKQCPAFTAKTPDRSLFSGHAPAKLDARREALNQYLDELVDTPLDLPTALELCKYLSQNTLPPNADETGTSAPDVSNVGVQKTGPGGRPFRTGYLTKRGKNFGGWKARFFLLDGPHLKYYETPGGAHLGTIKLQKAQIGKQSHNNSGDNASPARTPGTEEVDNQYRHAFLILEPKKKDPNSITKHVLCAESDRERDQWVDALLRWIDYQDPDDEDQAKKENGDRGGSEKMNGVNSKKKMYGQGRQQRQEIPTVENEGSLIGVSYEATKQGDIPQGAPSNSKHGHNEAEAPLTMSSQSAYAISAPRDPQVISNSEAWGTKLGLGLAPPNQEEKKIRKRSFFGFGPKTRTSSDGQDSLFGSDNGSTSSQPSNQYSGPVRQVFGAALAEAVRYNGPVDVKVPLPAVVFRCIQYLDAKNAILEEGIFRLSGSNVVIKQLRERFNNESDINLLTDEQYYDIHAVASLLKLYLRELPTTILTRDLHLEFLSATEMSDLREKVAALGELVQRLPQANATLLKYLIAFLIKIISHADTNKMTVRNVGIVFSPTLNIPAPVFAMFLQNYQGIFGIDPLEYELPSPVSEANPERRPSLPGERPFLQERRPSDPQRPSTSGGTGTSPHRQRLFDAMREGQAARSTPTPPPMNMQQMAQMNAMRSTPTPPPQRPLTYEPQFLAQQSQTANRVSLRPAYESGFVVPQGYDPTQLHTPTARPSNPGYDRPVYDNNGSAPYDQSFVKSRRESGMFMGNLHHQGSKSRLREEQRY